ncbi:MAG TPA: hypothetical protein VGR35_08990 [Tepidisphaeraceae bacterium]|nr:hypothetical protein [Tepidisphaeraceae bacterium]
MKCFAFGLGLVLVAFTLGGAEKAQLDELTGVIRTKGVKDLSPCVLTIDGNIPRSIGLRGEGLEDIPDGSQVWVRGRLHTSLYDNRDDPNPAMDPLQWNIYMDVADWKATAAPFERPAGGGGDGGTTAPTTQASQEDDWHRYDDPRLSADERKAVRAATEAVLDAGRPRPDFDRAFRYRVDQRNGDWVVTVWRVHSFKDGKPRFMPGGHTGVILDSDYKVKSKIPGR